VALAKFKTSSGCGSSPNNVTKFALRRGSSMRSVASHDADEAAVVAWPMSPTIVIDPA
jgi:hypothetical protein